MELTDRINALIDEKVSPVLAGHNGSARVSYIEGDTVWIRMEGACAGCAYAAGDVSGLIEKEITGNFPEIKHVRLDESVDQDLIDFAKKLMNGEK